MNDWLFDPDQDLRIRRLGWEDAGTAAEIAGRAFDSAATGERVRRMALISLAVGSAEIPLERQRHTLLPATYYLMVRGEPAEEIVLGLTGLYRRLWDEEDAGNYWLGWFALDPAFQGQGLGERLVTVTMAICAAKGGKRLLIETSPELQRAVRLYRRLGFTEAPVVPEYWGPGSGLLLFYRALDAAEFADLAPPTGVLL